jgi:hypothetical protein
VHVTINGRDESDLASAAERLGALHSVTVATVNASAQA